jgi:DNA invertase Pin-like site-specific DNA recombinase
VATQLDWLARSMHHLLDIVEQLKQKKASLRVLGMNLDTDQRAILAQWRSPPGRLQSNQSPAGRSV